MEVLVIVSKPLHILPVIGPPLIYTGSSTVTPPASSISSLTVIPRGTFNVTGFLTSPAIVMYFVVTGLSAVIAK